MRDELTETVSYPLAVYLVGRGFMPRSVHPLGDGTPRNEYAFNAADVQAQKAGFRRVQAILSPESTQATPTRRTTINVRSTDRP